MAEDKAPQPSSHPPSNGEHENHRPQAGQHRAFSELPGLEILEELARSPHGIVYKAKRQVEQDLVAVKSFKRALCRKEYTERLARNSETSFFLDHPALVRGLGCVNDSSRLLSLMEFAAGEALSRTLKQKLPVKASKALLIMLECVSGLQYAAGKGFYHGRLHPGDIMVNADQIRIIGVGMGERPEPAKTSDRPYLFEPLIYTAPEAMPSRPFPEGRDALQAVDVYALGAILFHLLTGSPPFRSNTEDALLNEHQNLRVPVDWPLTTALPPAACVVTDRMLARNPNLRPSYETLNMELKEALRAVEWAEKDNARNGSTAQAGAANGIRRVPVPVVPVSSYLPRPADPALFASKKRTSQGASISTVLLVALIAVILTYIITKFVALEPRAPDAVSGSAGVPPASRAAGTAALPGTAAAQAASPSTDASRTATPPAPAPAVASPQQKAAVQLDLIEERLRTGEWRHSAGLLKVVKDIAKNAGEDTPTGIRAIVLAAEIEESLVKNFNASSTPAQTPPAASAAKTPAAPAPPPEAASSEAPAKTAPVAQPTPPAQPDAKELEEQRKAKRVLAAAIKAVMAKAAKFQYTDLVLDLEKLAPENSSPENKKLAAGYADLVKEEQALFLRCRKRLLEEIERSPRKESPLQVRTNSKDPVGDDITDFDEKGLNISSKRGGHAAAMRTQEWEKVKPAQAYNLLDLLTDKSNLADQMGLVSFCYSRGLTKGRDDVLGNLRTLPDGKEKGDAAEELCKNIDALLALPAGD